MANKTLSVRDQELGRIRAALDNLNLWDSDWRDACAARIVAQRDTAITWAACSPVVEDNDAENAPEAIAAYNELIANAPRWLRWLLRHVDEVRIRDQQIENLYKLNDQLRQELSELRGETGRQYYGQAVDVPRRTPDIDD